MWWYLYEVIFIRGDINTRWYLYVVIFIRGDIYTWWYLYEVIFIYGGHYQSHRPVLTSHRPKAARAFDYIYPNIHTHTLLYRAFVWRVYVCTSRTQYQQLPSPNKQNASNHHSLNKRDRGRAEVGGDVASGGGLCTGWLERLHGSISMSRTIPRLKIITSYK